MTFAQPLPVPEDFISSYLDIPFLSGSCLCIKCTFRIMHLRQMLPLSLVVRMLRSFISQNGIDQRMNGVCAGGTGSFIDQMASLLQTDAGGLNEYAKDYDTIYPIAARCGVFAKTDIQPSGSTKVLQNQTLLPLFSRQS